MKNTKGYQVQYYCNGRWCYWASNCYRANAELIAAGVTRDFGWLTRVEETDHEP